MEIFKPVHFFQKSVALFGSVLLILPLVGGEVGSGPGLADRELSRRSGAMDEAQELLRKGDEAYTSGRYEDALTAYLGARDLIPDAPISAELRAAATSRYAQASVEHARFLSRKGDVAEAKAVVDRVLAPTVAPNDPGAVNFRAQLDDPIRTNPALTAEYAKDVDSVRRTLYTAEGAYNLGKFDEAKSQYEAALRIDPTNTAARRGLESVAVAKSKYQKSAYDQTRAEMLSQVDGAWELQPEAGEIDPALTSPGFIGAEGETVSVKNKLTRIIIPKISLDQVSLDEAVDFLRIRANENDTLELDPALKGVNFTVNLGPPDSPEALRLKNLRFDLQVSNVPLHQALKYITEATRTSFSADEYSVTISPLGSSKSDLVVRTYRVPPDFISSMGAGVSSAAPSDDPFAAAPAGEGLLAKRLGAQEALEKQGIQFPQGASASYIPSSGTLRVINTEANQDIISQIIEVITRVEPVVVAVRVTMIKTEQTNLQELGFDWFLEDLGFGGESAAPGADKGNLTGGTQGNGRGFDDVIAPVETNSLKPITSGNRSGDSAISGDSIDGVIGSQRGRQVTNSAPGIFGAYGTFDNAKIQMLMRGLEQKKGVDLVSQPSIVTRSGQSSSIAIVREFIYASEYEPPEIPNNVGLGLGAGVNPVTPSTPTAFETKDVGVTLEVLPVVDAEKRFISVTLNPVFSEFDGFVNYGSPINSSVTSLTGTESVEVTGNAILMPIFSKEAVTTTVDVADGATIVIGGLMQENLQNVEDQTPILGSIPIVGRLFQSKAREVKSKMIFFLVNVELMDPTGRRYRDR
jgi:general secretion pathway protein D